MRDFVLLDTMNGWGEKIQDFRFSGFTCVEHAAGERFRLGRSNSIGTAFVSSTTPDAYTIDSANRKKNFSALISGMGEEIRLDCNYIQNLGVRYIQRTTTRCAKNVCFKSTLSLRQQVNFLLEHKWTLNKYCIVKRLQTMKGKSKHCKVISKNFFPHLSTVDRIRNARFRITRYNEWLRRNNSGFSFFGFYLCRTCRGWAL